jgi:malate dehydrogenase (quinone)
VPHLSFVQGEKGVSFLKKRFDPEPAPCVLRHAIHRRQSQNGRVDAADDAGPPGRREISATRVMNGTDVNFGALTKQLLKHLASAADTQIKYSKKSLASSAMAAAGR